MCSVNKVVAYSSVSATTLYPFHYWFTVVPITDLYSAYAMYVCKQDQLCNEYEGKEELMTPP